MLSPFVCVCEGGRGGGETELLGIMWKQKSRYERRAQQEWSKLFTG